MLVTLDTPYADTTAADLSFTLGSPELPALHVLDLARPDHCGVTLRLLGASHQVVLRGADRGFIETVACLPGRRSALPSTVDDEAAGYRFAARVSQLSSDELSRRVAALRQELADDPYALVGVFPGGPDAATALCVDTAVVAGGRTGFGWRTWHAYPQTGELVETETVVMVR